MDAEWLTVEDVSEHLKVDPETVRKWVRRGKLKVLSLGRSNRSGYRILKSELGAFIAKKTRPQKDAPDRSLRLLWRPFTGNQAGERYPGQR